MTNWLFIDLSVFLCVVAITGIIIPQILLIAFRKQLFDTPDPRKIHKAEIPRLGGIAFFPAILFALFLVFGGGMLSEESSIMSYIYNNIRSVSFMMCGTIVMWLVGMADDLVGVRYRAKFIMQALAAELLILGGIELTDLHGFLGIGELPTAVSVILTALISVFIINALNLIDGIDGLASGLSGVACAFYTYMFFHAGLYLFSAIAVATLGVLVPFFVYNVFGNAEKQRKIFMGDTGALTIGLLLSAMSLRICQLDTLPEGCNPAVVAFAPLLIPCFDVVRVYLHRIRIGHNPFLPDKNHIHHKFLALGMSQRSAMMVIIAASTALVLANYWLSAYINITLLLACDIAVWLAANMAINRAKRARERKLAIKISE